MAGRNRYERAVPMWLSLTWRKVQLRCGSFMAGFRFVGGHCPPSQNRPNDNARRGFRRRQCKGRRLPESKRTVGNAHSTVIKSTVRNPGSRELDRLPEGSRPSATIVHGIIQPASRPIAVNDPLFVKQRCANHVPSMGTFVDSRTLVPLMDQAEIFRCKSW